ncbi:MAG: DUF5680 domain-containing protein [bacterium]|nr:DUF5680 domain-containing protein [bacterium]
MLKEFVNNPIYTKELADFLHEANKNTYANKDAPKVAPSRLKSKGYHFEKGDLIYYDTYFGGRDFIGGEIVYKNQKPVWGENYFGFILDKNVSEKDVYDFLRMALMQEYDDTIPVRGPSNFSADNKTYTFIANGDLENFSGKEEISFHGKVVYRCFVHGGFIR